jgi:predicted short-subunit dehydrogenase-like oxidoreductase (DUF2520 family)
MTSIFLFGYGNVGTYLAEKLKKSFKINGIYDPNKKPSDAVKDIYYTDLESVPVNLIVNADIIIIAVNDDAIDSAIEDLIHSMPAVALKAVMHTSGNFSADMLEPLNAHFGAKMASFHPYMTFNGTTFPEDFFYWGFEGNSHLFPLAERIAEACVSGIIRLTKEQKKLYHISGVFASNFLIAHLRITARLIMEAILTNSENASIEPGNVILPLVRQTIANADRESLNKALSGPLKRNDIQTLRSHMVELEEKFPDLAYLYNFYSIELIDLLDSVGFPINNDIKRFFEV